MSLIRDLLNMAQDLLSERVLYQLLREWLSQREPDLWADFERDPEETAPRLRAFLERAAAAIPPALATCVSGGQVERLVNIAQAGVVYIQPAEVEPILTHKERRKLERDYLERVAEDCRYLETEGVDQTRAEMTDVFVMLEAVQRPRREAEADVAPVPERAEEMGLEERAAAHFGRREAEREKRASPPPPVPLSQALGAHTHLVVLGEPGTGKTTTLQFVALCFATDGRAKARLDLDEARVPVRVALREYDGAERLDRFLIRWLDRAYTPEPLAQSWLNDGRLAVLLDGLDEVPQARRVAVTKAIERFAATPEGRRCRILVTSRIAGYREGRSLGADFDQYTICPFAGPQTAQPYVAGWLRALKPEATAGETEAFLDAMEQQGGLRWVMGNPLLLRLAVAVYVKTGGLARSRAELYRRYVDEVTWERAEARERSRWSRRQIEATLEAVAWALQTQDEQTAAALAEVVEEEVAGVADGQNLLNYLRERLGLLAVYGYERGDLVAFRHLTFQEYFAVRRLKGAWEEDPERAWCFLRPRLHHPAWREPILLLGGMLDEKRATDLVRRILQARSPYERELHRDLLLAAAVVGDGAPVAADVAGRVTGLVARLYLDVRVKWRHQLILPTSIWFLLTAGLHRYGPVPCCLIPLGTLIWWGIWLLSVWWGFFPRLQGIFAFLHRLSGKCAYHSLREQVRDGLARLPRPQRARVMAPLIRALGDKKPWWLRWEATVEAVKALGAIGDPWAVVPLIRALEDKCWLVREAAAGALGQIGDPRAVAPFIRALGDEDGDVRRAAAGALGAIGDPRAVEPLIRALGDEEWWVREAAAWALGAIGDPRAVEPLTRALGDEDVRWAAAWALEAIGDPAVEPLIRALGDEDGDVRWAAAEALRAIGDPRAMEPLIRALGDEDVRWAAARALGAAGDPAVEPLIRALGNKDVRWAAAAALRAIGDPAVAPLIWALGDEDEDVRRAAAWALGAISDPRAVEPLIWALGDEDEDVRRAAAWALGAIGDPRAVEPLIRALGDRSADVRRAAAEALKAIGDPAVEPLIRALGDRSADVRRAAAEALKAIGDPAVALLSRALGDEDGDVRRAAAEALGAIGDPAVAPLIRALGDEREWVRWVAVEALGTIGDPRAVEPLIRALGDENVRRAAARALGATGDPRAVAPLIWALGDENRDVRRAAAAALRAIGDPAVEPLIRALGDENRDVRRATARALGAIGDPRAVEPLIRAVGDWDEGMRRASAEALEAMGEKIEDRRTARRAARRLWWRLTDVEKVANAAWEALARMVARLTELEVAALGAGPPLFAPAPVEARPSPALSIILSILIAALSGLASNILAAYLQERYRLISDAGRFGLVVAVFVLTLVASIGLALRQEKGTAEAAERQ